MQCIAAEHDALPDSSGRRPASCTLLRNAAYDGVRRLRRRRQTRHRSSRRRSARRRHLPLSHAIHALAFCTGHARPLEPLPPRSRTHALTHMPALWNAPRGVRVGGIQRCNPPALGTCVGTRCQRMPLCALARLSGCAIFSCHESCTGVAHVQGCVMRYAHAQ